MTTDIDKAIELAGEEIYQNICKYIDAFDSWRSYMKHPRLYRLFKKEPPPTRPIDIHKVIRFHIMPLIEVMEGNSQCGWARADIIAKEVDSLSAELADLKALGRE